MKLSGFQKHYIYDNEAEGLEPIGMGQHGATYIYPWDQTKVLKISREYRSKTLPDLISKTSELKTKGCRVPEVHDFVTLERDSDMYERVAIIEDYIDGGIHIEDDRDQLDKLRVLDKLDHRYYKKMFEDASQILNSGVALDLKTAGNLIVTCDGITFIDLHDVQDEISYSTTRFEDAAVGLYNILLRTQPVSVLEPWLDRLTYLTDFDLEKQRLQYSISKNVIYGLLTADIDEQNKSLAFEAVRQGWVHERIAEAHDYHKLLIMNGKIDCDDNILDKTLQDIEATTGTDFVDHKRDDASQDPQ